MRTCTTEVLIVGAGPAGLAAAQAAAGQGCRVMLIDDNPAVGGQIWRAGPLARQSSAVLRFKAMLDQHDVTALTGARVVAAPAANVLLVETTHDSIRVNYRRLVLCTGARELLLPFPGWTLPGVTGIGGLQALIKSGYDLRGQRAVLAGSGPLLLATARTLRQTGMQVLRIVEQAPWQRLARFAAGLWRWPGKARQSLILASTRYRCATHVSEALGDTRLEAVRLQTSSGRCRTMSCDWLGCGFGLVPNNELGRLLGCELRGDALAVDELQNTSQPDILAAGECSGIGGCELALAEGRLAGLQAAASAGNRANARRDRARWRVFAKALERTFVLDEAVRNLAAPDTIICRCEDVTRQTLDAEADWTTAKLVSRCGMGACQGRICGPATRYLYCWQRSAPRPPLLPARIDTLSAERVPASASEASQ